MQANIENIMSKVRIAGDVRFAADLSTVSSVHCHSLRHYGFHHAR